MLQSFAAVFWQLYPSAVQPAGHYAVPGLGHAEAAGAAACDAEPGLQLQHVCWQAHPLQPDNLLLLSPVTEQQHEYMALRQCVV